MIKRILYNQVLFLLQNWELDGIYKPSDIPLKEDAGSFLAPFGCKLSRVSKGGLTSQYFIKDYDDRSADILLKAIDDKDPVLGYHVGITLYDGTYVSNLEYDYTSDMQAIHDSMKLFQQDRSVKTVAVSTIKAIRKYELIHRHHRKIPGLLCVEDLPSSQHLSEPLDDQLAQFFQSFAQ